MFKWFRYLLAALSLAGLQWLGDGLVALLGGPLPGSLLGLLMLLAALFAFGGVPQSLEAVSSPLLRHLMLFLIPSVAAVGLHAGLLSRHLVVFVLAATVVTALTIAVTGWTLHRLMRGRQP